jgi:hypothetical protein
MRLEEKLITPLGDGRSRVKRRYDTAQTPFDRLCATGKLDPAVRKKLEQLRRETNPRQLRQEIGRMLDKLQALPQAREGRREEVHATLFEGEKTGGRPKTLHRHYLLAERSPFGDIYIWWETP